MKLKDSHHLYAIITILFWSLAYVLTRLALQVFSPSSLGFLRYFVASCTLSVVVVFAKIRPPKKADLILFFVSGAIGFFLYIILCNKGLETVTASTGSVVIATVPVITSLLARVIYKETLSLFQWVAIVIELVGVVVLTMLNGVFSINSGLILLFLAALALSIYNLLQRRLTRKYSALQTAAYSIFFGTALLVLFLPHATAEVLAAPAISLVYIVLLGVFSSALAYVSWSTALSKAKQISQVSNYMFVTPFITSVLGFVLANEIPDRATILGGAIILLGVFVFNFGGRIKGIHTK